VVKSKKGELIPPRSLRLLVVEDNPADAELAVAMLERAGYQLSFDVVHSPIHFQQQLEQNDYDIILSAHHLAAWTGTEALEILKASAKGVPFVVLTATLGDEAAVEYIRQGAADYILKHHLERLPAVVVRVLREKAHQEEVARLREVISSGKREWELTFDTVPDPVLLMDRECLIRRANRAAAKLLGLEFSEIIGRPCSEMLHGRARPPSECPHCRTLETGNEERGDIEEPRLGKTFDTTASPVRDPSGCQRGCVVVLRDVTERKKLEERLRQSQKLEAIGGLAGGIAHDFNNLLTLITGYSRLLLDQLTSEDPVREKVEEIRKAGERAAALTHQLLAFSRRQVLAPQPLDLNVVVAKMDKMLRRLIGEDIELATAFGAASAWVKADPGQIEQVIMNLAVNARDAMSHGGKLTIETADVVLDKAYARRHVAVTPGPYVMLAVSDTGCGVEAEIQAHMFEPFFTTKEMDKGTGLGLSTVYGIVKQSGGNIWVYSEVGRGTTLKIYLPRLEKGAEAVGPSTALAHPVGGWESILLVEDEDSVRSLVRGVLKSNGYKVLEARRGEEALKIAKRHGGPIQLLLTDVIMPRMSGRELAKRLAAQRPEMKVLYMSGYTDSAIVHHGVLDPGMSFLQKPFTPEILARKVREVLDQQFKNE
jgi:PAS domain S-box-containing protein